MDYFISRFNSFVLGLQGLTTENLQEKTKVRFNYVQDSEILMICLPSWGQTLWTWGKIENHAEHNSCSMLAYDFPRPILSDSAESTKHFFELVEKRVRADIQNLKKQYGFQRCILVALSLASSYGSMIYRDNPDISQIIMIAPGENLARDMWYGCRTQHLHKSYQAQGIDLSQLENAWDSLDSENNFPAPDTKISLFYGAQDKVIPVPFSSRLKDVLSEKGFKTSAQFLNCGHYGLISRFLLSPQRFLTSI